MHVTHKPTYRWPGKEDRNDHEMSAEESRQVESRELQARGGGHRSGSRGAGTCDRPDWRPERGQRPMACSKQMA
jgi:hypothetical protein